MVTGREAGVTDYVRQLEATLERVTEASAKHLEWDAQRRDTQRPMQRREGKMLCEGDYVVAAYPERAPSKLHPTYRGPLLVVGAERPDVVTCLDLVSQKRLVMHADRLRRFILPEGTTDDELKALAAVDHDEYVVESVLEHRFRASKRLASHLELLIAWAGYDKSEATWEPYSNLRDVAIVHRYVVDLGVKGIAAQAGDD